MHLEKITVEVDYVVGDKVKVIEGPLEGFTGDVIELEVHNKKCRVNVEMFGRTTPVELDLMQISKLD
jgi:transcriptional antiterminator NusG